MRSLITPALCIPPPRASPRAPPQRGPGCRGQAPRSPLPRRAARLLPCTPQCFSRSAAPGLTRSFCGGVYSRPQTTVAAPPCDPSPKWSSWHLPGGAPAHNRRARSWRLPAEVAVAAGGAAGAERGQLRPSRPRHRRARLTRLLGPRSLRRGVPRSGPLRGQRGPRGNLATAGVGGKRCPDRATSRHRPLQALEGLRSRNVPPLTP